MKQFVILYTLFSFLLLSVTSCTDKEESIQQVVEPGTYYIDKDLSAIAPSTKTRGVNSSSLEFDTNYDYDYIYLHNIKTSAYIKIPIYSCSNDGTSTCKGFHYKMVVDKNGDAIIYPLDENGVEIKKETGNENVKLELGKDETCYFSSWDSDTWDLKTEQISEQRWANNSGELYYLFYRDKSVNKEIYRSGHGVNIQNFTISDLTVNGTLNLTRACANFSLGVVFYNEDNYKKYGNQIFYETTSTDFSNAMGDDFGKWYIKIYIGGTCFPSSFNIVTNQAIMTNITNGYYSSGDAAKFGAGDISGKKYLAFSEIGFAQDLETFGGYGYYSESENTLLSPVTGSNQASTYLLIKHWTGTSAIPGDAWLNSDVGALQTIISQSGVVYQPANSSSYKIRCAIDLGVLAEAWGGAAGDKAQNDLIFAAGIDPETGNKINSSSDSSIPVAYSTTVTRSPSGEPVRSFTLPEDAIVIQEVY